MKARRRLLVALAVAALAPAAAHADGLTQEQAVAIALKRSRDAIAARLEIEGAELDVVAARVYPNPTFSYEMGNLVLGKGNPQGGAANPGFFDQPIQQFGLSQTLDLWSKRGARESVASAGVDRRRLLTEDALREIAYAVRSAFADVVREQSERDLAREVAGRYAETVRLSQARFKAGDISEAELRKIELEAIRYENAVIDADMQWDVARQALAALMGLGSARELPGERVDDSAARPTFDVEKLTNEALTRRPDLRAAGAAHAIAEAEVKAARREIYPDLTLGATYTHDSFTISGDNPDSLGFGVSLPLPVFDRNKAGLGRARLDVKRADNDRERLRLAVAHDVADAVRKAARAQSLLRIFEGSATPPGEAPPAAPAPNSTSAAGPPAAAATSPVASGQVDVRNAGGMLARAEAALRVAEKSYKAGAASLLDLLEAQRTNLDTRAEYLRVLYDYRQAVVDVTHAVGEGAVP
ncbi:MAG TPA: TolC family protein [Polyangia bacterium]|nr:TolC family protein [Polyangia bacterium]